MRILALDIDGTLITSQHVLTEPVRSALIRAQRDYDIRIALASGRPTAALGHLAAELELKTYGGYLLPFNGGKLIAAATGEVLSETVLDADLIPQLYDLTQRYDLNILSYTEDTILSERSDDPYAVKEIDITGMALEVVPDFRALSALKLPKCLAVGPKDKLIPLEAEAKQLLGERIDAFRSSDFFLELVPKGIDKGAALSRLLELLGLTPEALIAMGDNYNDLGMLRLAGTSVAMGNAPEDIKAVASYVTRTNNEDGVAYALEELVFARS